MKKVFLILFSLLIMIGCSNNILSDEDKLYIEIESKLKKQTFFTTTKDFNIEITETQVNKKYRYVLTIDNTKISMYDITVLCDGGEDEDMIFPSIGIYDNEDYNLIPNTVDKDNGYYKGIQLSGLVENREDAKVYIHYYVDKGKTKEKELYLKVKV